MYFVFIKNLYLTKYQNTSTDIRVVILLIILHSERPKLLIFAQSESSRVSLRVNARSIKVTSVNIASRILDNKVFLKALLQ